MVLSTSLRIERTKMAMQTIATTKGQEMIEKFGVKIGAEVWEELEKFLSNAEESSQFCSEKVLFLDTKGVEYKERDFVVLFKKIISAMDIAQRKSKREFLEYYIVTPKPTIFYVGYEWGDIRSNSPTTIELMPFLFLGIARGAWTIEDAIYHIDKCTVQNLQAKS